MSEPGNVESSQGRKANSRHPKFVKRSGSDGALFTFYWVASDEIRMHTSVSL